MQCVSTKYLVTVFRLTFSEGGNIVIYISNVDSHNGSSRIPTPNNVWHVFGLYSN